MQSARGNRAAAMASRANTKASVEAIKRSKTADADQLRKWEAAEWDFEVTAEGIRDRKAHIAAAYRTRWASEEDATEWMHSPLKRLHDAARFAMEAAATAVGRLGGFPPAAASARGRAQEADTDHTA